MCYEASLVYGRHNLPSERTNQNVSTKFQTNFTLLDNNPSARMRRARTEENIAAVAEIVGEDREQSIRRHATKKWKTDVFMNQPL